MEPTRIEERIDGIDNRLDRLTERVDSFVYFAQRLLNQFGDRLQASEFQTERIERLENVVQSLARTQQQFQQNQERLQENQLQLQESQQQLQESQQQMQQNYQQLQENQRSTTAAIERMDRILDYLVRQEGQS